MRNLIYRCGQSGYFFLNLSNFFQFSKNGREGLPLPPPTCPPVYYKMKGKREEKHPWRCRPKRNWNSPCNVQRKKSFFKKITWSEISQLFFFFAFFSILHKWNPPQILFKYFEQIYSWNVYRTTISRNNYSNRKLSVTSSGITKTFK